MRFLCILLGDKGLAAIKNRKTDAPTSVDK